MIDFINELKKHIPQQCLITEPLLKKNYETDWRNSFSSKCIAVLFPITTLQIQQIVILCTKYNIKITPQGGNTSKCGGAIPSVNLMYPHIIINLSKLNKIINFNLYNKNICVESGCTLAQIQNFVSDKNMYFPLELASSDTCQIGGNIATNAGGTNVLRYGMIRNLVYGLEIVLPNGEIINQTNSLIKNNTYIDLKQIFIGSEGTLGIITKASLKIFTKPLNHLTFFISTSSLNYCLDILQKIQSQTTNLNAFEIINKFTQNIYNNYFDKIPIYDEWLILGEIEYNSESQKDYLFTIVEKIKYTSNILVALNETEREYFWNIRKNIPLAEKKYGHAIKFDISLPLDKINEFINFNYQCIHNHLQDNDIIIFGHLGDGSLHYNIPITHKTNIDVIQELTYTNIIKFNGSFSAEHGIGQLKNQWYFTFYKNNGYNLAKQIKDTIDPLNIFNPGKVFST